MDLHRILLQFQHYQEFWRVSFLEADCKTNLPLKINFSSPDKIREMYRRHAKARMLEDEQAVEHGIEIGRGGFWLEVNEDQYQILQARKRRQSN
jgi:hypothetical protein